jgi:hypothetical protein
MRCLCCDKPVKKDTKMWTAPREPSTYNPVPGWRYTGNLIVVKKHYVKVDGERRLSAVYVWDGETYFPSYGYFCRDKCAAIYGRKAAERGIRL